MCMVILNKIGTDGFNLSEFKSYLPTKLILKLIPCYLKTGLKWLKLVSSIYDFGNESKNETTTLDTC